MTAMVTQCGVRHGGMAKRQPSAVRRRVALGSVVRPRLPILRERTRLNASSASDPYQVLGVTRKMSSDSVQRVYRNKLREAKQAGDEELVSRIEEAHSSIMMQELTKRVQGQGVAQDVAYADKAVYLPWRPRYYLADGKLAVIALALQAALFLYSLVMSGATGTQPVIGSTMACAGIVYFKLEKLFPSGGGAAFSADPAERKQGAKNLLRCVVVALMGTALGIVLFFTLPDFISNVILHKPLPYWIYDNQDMVLNSGVVFMNLIMSIFFR